jgi:flagellar basal body-associated protein FliL
MSEVKNKKKKLSIIQVSIGVLAVILAILIIIMMGMSQIFRERPVL